VRHHGRAAERALAQFGNLTLIGGEFYNPAAGAGGNVDKTRAKRAFSGALPATQTNSKAGVLPAAARIQPPRSTPAML